MSHLSLPITSTIAVTSTIPAVVYLGYLMFSQGKEEQTKPAPKQKSQFSFDQLQDKLYKVQRSRLDTIEEESNNDKEYWKK